MHKGDAIRLLALRLLETIVGFGLESNPLSLDPRRKAIVKTGSTSIDIDLNHPFIDRQKIEREADELFSKLELWSIRGGPQSYPFSAGLLAQLGR
jgi:hypothetical protein